MTQKRSIDLDVAKGIEIILMVWGHAIQCGLGNNYLDRPAFYDNVIYKLIYGCHMPPFMLISGYIVNLTLARATRNYTYSILLSVIETALIISVSVIITYVIKRIKICNTVFLGGR